MRFLAAGLSEKRSRRMSAIAAGKTAVGTDVYQRLASLKEAW